MELQPVFHTVNKVLIWKILTGNRVFQIKSHLTDAAESRRAAVSQTVKVKAETNPVSKTQPLLDRVQLDWTNPEKTIQKSLNWRGRKTGKKEKKRDVVQTSFHRYLKRIVFRCWLFLLRALQEKPLQSTKLNVRNVKLPACVFSTRLQDSLLIHAVQCNGTWTWIIIAFKIVVMIPFVIIPFFSLKKNNAVMSSRREMLRS